ncbi:hypothetical protein STRDD13_00822 [Streptococcus sp. DD13]|nr:hypothetical protein STRDD13_00822 [Streptococcus sp. DD13]
MATIFTLSLVLLKFIGQAMWDALVGEHSSDQQATLHKA